MSDPSGFRSGAFRYSNEDADAYGSFAILGTTYEVGFNAIAELLGDLTGTVWLDFGSGTGRSSHFLRRLGAVFVVGVDHNLSMIRRARSHGIPGIGYALIDRIIPLADESMNGAISCSVYVEMPTRYEMDIACAEIYRVLKPGSSFVLMSTNPLAIGHEFKSFTYPQPAADVSSGSRILCLVKTQVGVVEIEDTYWTHDDYTAAVCNAGFTICNTLTPVASSHSFRASEEAIVGPFIIVACLKE